MGSCENCIHYELCSSISLKKIGISLIPQDECCGYKDRSRFVELPANDGFRTVRNVDDLGRVLIPKCIRREYDINYRDRILFIPINESKILVSKFLGSKEEEQALKERENNG